MQAVFFYVSDNNVILTEDCIPVLLEPNARALEKHMISANSGQHTGWFALHPTCLLLSFWVLVTPPHGL